MHRNKDKWFNEKISFKRWNFIKYRKTCPLYWKWSKCRYEEQGRGHPLCHVLPGCLWDRYVTSRYSDSVWYVQQTGGYLVWACLFPMDRSGCRDAQGTHSAVCPGVPGSDQGFWLSWNHDPVWDVLYQHFTDFGSFRYPDDGSWPYLGRSDRDRRRSMCLQSRASGRFLWYFLYRRRRSRLRWTAGTFQKSKKGRLEPWRVSPSGIPYCRYLCSVSL